MNYKNFTPRCVHGFYRSLNLCPECSGQLITAAVANKWRTHAARKAALAAKAARKAEQLAGVELKGAEALGERR